MNLNPHRRVVVVSAISGVLVFGAAGFAAAATGGIPHLQAPVIAPAAVTDPSVTGPGSSINLGGLVGDDEGTEVENTEATEPTQSSEVESTESSEVENESDDQGDDDQGDDHGGNSVNSGQGNQGGGDHGGDHGGGGDDD